jgi:hypothetical protein
MAHPEVMNGWEQYPNKISPLPYEVHDLQAHRQRLLQLKERLFSGQGDIEVWRHKENDSGKYICIVIIVALLTLYQKVAIRGIFSRVRLLRHYFRSTLS